MTSKKKPNATPTNPKADAPKAAPKADAPKAKAARAFALTIRCPNPPQAIQDRLAELGPQWVRLTQQECKQRGPSATLGKLK